MYDTRIARTAIRQRVLHCGVEINLILNLLLYIQWGNVDTWRPRLYGAHRPLKVAKLLYIIKLLKNGRK